MAANLPNIGLSSIEDGSKFVCKMPLNNVNSEAFLNCATLTSIEILCANSIEASAFQNCDNVRTLILPGITTYDKKIFGNSYNISLDYLEIKHGTLNIGTTFNCVRSSYDGGTVDIKLPASLTSLQENALQNVPCNSLSLGVNTALKTGSLNILNLNTLTCNISKADANLHITANNIYCLKPSNNYSLGTQLSGSNAYLIVFENFGSTITSITSNSFADCNITSLNLQNASFTSIPTDAFKNCRSLLQIYLPNTVRVYNENCFRNCNGLANFTLNINNATTFNYLGYNAKLNAFPNSLNSFGPSAFMNATFSNAQCSINLDRFGSLNPYAFYVAHSYINTNITSFTLNTSLKTIPEYCFYNLTNVKSYINSNELTSIEQYAFSNNTSLTSINLNKIVSIGPHAFEKCSSLSTTGFILPTSLTSWGDHIFDSCTFSTIEIPNIGYFNINRDPLFINCNNVLSVTINSTFSNFVNANSTIDIDVDDVMTNASTNPEIVKKAHREVCKILFGTPNHRSNIIFNDILLTNNGLGNEYFCLEYYNYNDITYNIKHTLSNINTTYLDYNVFYKNAILDPSTLSVTNTAFDNALTATTNKLSLINMNNVQHFNGTLSNTSYLTEVIANNLLNVSQCCFKNDNNLSLISLYSIRTIPNYCFDGCERLSNIDSLTLITSIGQYAFNGCTGLTSIQNLLSLESIGQYAFNGCTGLTSIQNLLSLESIGQYAFNGCTGLTSIQNLLSLESIGQYAFNGCSNLKIINLQNSEVTTLTINIFKDLSRLEKIYFPSGITSLNDNSLCCSSSNLCVIFDNTLSDISTKLRFSGDTCNNAIQSPIKTLFYTTTSNYPSFITKAAGEIISIKDYLNVNRDCKLIGIDSNIIRIPQSDISSLNGIASTALNNSNVLIIHLSESMYTNTTYIANGAFSISNAPSLKTIYVNMSITDSNRLTIINSANQFLINKTSNNNNIAIQFDNAAYILGPNGYQLLTSIDPFINYNIDYKNIIIGVRDDVITSNPDVYSNGIVSIPLHYTDISSYAFLTTLALKHIESFSNVSYIHANAFSFNTSIHDLSIIGNTDISIDINAFTESSLSNVTLCANIINTNNISGLQGYGLNKCSIMKQLLFGHGVTYIAPSAMINAISPMSSITLPNTLSSIGEYAFAETYDRFPRLRNVNFREASSLTSIGDYAFYNSIQSLAPDNKLTFPKNLKLIGNAAFAYRWESYTDEVSNLNDLEPIDVNMRNITDIGMSAFMYNKFKSVKFNDQISNINNYAFAYSKYKYDIHIPSSIEHIGINAFYKNVILNPKNIKKNIVSIDCDIADISTIFDISVNTRYEADNKIGFTNATVISALDSANSYNSFAYISNNKMMFCPSNLSIDLVNLTLIKVDNASITAYILPYLTAIGPSAFYNCKDLTSVSAHLNILENNILYIGPSAFYNCSSLTEITNLENDDTTFYLSNVEAYTFYNCLNLTNIKFLSTTNYINEYAFTNCKSIESFYTEDTRNDVLWWTLSNIGNYAFASCDALTSFDIPKSIKHIGTNVFKDCPSLNNINLHFNSDEFLRITGMPNIETAVYHYFNTINTNGDCYINFYDIIYMNNGIVKIDNEYLETNTIDSNNIIISALKYNDLISNNKTYLNLSNITEIDLFIFSGILQLASISFLGEKSLKRINDYAFNGCTKLISFNNGKFNGEYIGTYAFSNCQNILTFALNYNNITKYNNQLINLGAFFGTSLNELKIENVIDSIDTAINKIKTAIGYNETTNPNPLELPEYCVITFYDSSYNLIGKYDYLFHNLLGSTIDINRNALIFTDKSRNSIRPLLLIKQINDRYLPAIITNTFHANIIGRWK